VQSGGINSAFNVALCSVLQCRRHPLCRAEFKAQLRWWWRSSGNIS